VDILLRTFGFIAPKKDFERTWLKITIIRYAQNRKIGKSNNLKMFGNNKTKKQPNSAMVTYAWGRRTLLIFYI
jgi:hypothetical protein